jgi:3-methyladenine DNA glycosylase AlkD
MLSVNNKEKKMLKSLREKIQTLANPSKAEKLQKFFKTGKGDYAEGDIFLGIIVPEQRKLSKDFLDLSYADLQILLNSNFHEERLTSLLILVKKYEQQEHSRKEVFDFYLRNTKKINNWDLVDLSAPKITGPYLLEKDKTILYSLAKSQNLWERRIAIVSTWFFIRKNLLHETLKIAEILLQDPHDLIHKAVGWMLREAGKKDEPLLEVFLQNHSQKMPRTMLRYAIEKMEETKRKDYLACPKL